jgi:hypothetical protein
MVIRDEIYRDNLDPASGKDINKIEYPRLLLN